MSPNRPCIRALARAAAVACLAASVTAVAADADLDRTFGTLGRYTAAIDAGGSLADVASSVLRTPTGQLLLVGSAATATVESRLAITRLDDAGVEIARTTHAYGFRTVGPAALDGTQRVVATGTLAGADGGLDGAVVRIRADGVADPAFGNLGTTRLDHPPFEVEVPLDVAVRADGSSAVLAESFNIGDTVVQPVLFGLSPGGALETPQGSPSVLIGIFSGGVQGSGAMALDAAGRLVIALSQRVAGGVCDLVVVRLQAGRIDAYDPTFGAQGFARLRLQGGPTCVQVRDLELQSDQKIVLAGNVEGTGPADLGVLLRLGADGALDTGFGSGGQSGVGLFGSSTTVSDIALQSDGGIVVAGSVRPTSGSPSRQLVLRVRANGVLDTGFADGNYFASFAFPASGGGESAQNVGHAVLVDPRDRIVVAGSRQWALSDTDFTALRLVGTPQLFASGFE